MMNWQTVDVPTHPVKNGRWVKVVAHIRRVSDGMIRKFENSEVLDDGEKYPSTYLWQDGNFGCDCNRETFFSIAGEDPDCECGEGKYQVNLENPVTGEIYYREF